MRIQGPSYVHNAQPLNGPHRTAAPASTEASNQAQPTDELTLSAEGVAISQSQGEFRADRVAQIRAEIAAGTYETDAKLEVALSRLLDEVA